MLEDETKQQHRRVAHQSSQDIHHMPFGVTRRVQNVERQGAHSNHIAVTCRCRFGGHTIALATINRHVWHLLVQEMIPPAVIVVVVRC